MVHARTLEGRTLSFGHTGWLWRNSFLIYDRDTDSIWHHVTGIAMTGPLRGKRLARFDDTAIMTFAAWRAEHPDTLVLAKPDEYPEPLDRDVFDDRNSRFEFGLALDLPGADRFYPFRLLATLDAVADDAGGVPVLVVRDVDAAVARAYDRRVGGSTLEFDVVPGPRPLVRERGGKRSWYLRSGEAVEGTGADAPLRPLPATPFERTAWRAQHGSGSVWERR